MVGPAFASCEPATTDEFSWKIVMRTVPPSPICGLHAQRQADVLALDGLERVDRAAVPAPVLVKLPVTNGTFWPMTIFASSLSSVTRFGVDRMFAPVLVSRKRASAAIVVDAAELPQQADVQPGGDRQHGARRVAGGGADRDVDDVVAAGAEVGAGDDAVARSVVADQALPLEAEVGRLVARPSRRSSTR